MPSLNILRPSSIQRGFKLTNKDGRETIFMQSKEELSLKVTKEIVVKFIEMGGISVNSFEGVWKKIHRTVCDSLKETAPEK